MKPLPVPPLPSPGHTDGLVPPMTSRFVCGVRLRASLPVASNRSFIRAWAARRAQVAASAVAAKRLTP